MRIVETDVNQVVEYTPAGHSYVNPYFGCTAECPFCYWLSIDGWEHKIDVRRNLPRLLDEALTTGLPDKRFYMGSYCDPYMEGIEDQYGITRQCLEVFSHHNVPVTLCTGARTQLVLRDIDLFERMPNLTHVMELCRPDQLLLLRDRNACTSICIANALATRGLHVEATFAPLMPGITDLGQVLALTLENIIISVDSMHIVSGTIQAARTLDFVQRNYPDLAHLYRTQYFGDDSYLDKMLEPYAENPRVKRISA